MGDGPRHSGHHLMPAQVCEAEQLEPEPVLRYGMPTSRVAALELHRVFCNLNGVWRRGWQHDTSRVRSESRWPAGGGGVRATSSEGTGLASLASCLFLENSVSKARW